MVRGLWFGCLGQGLVIVELCEGSGLRPVRREPRRSDRRTGSAARFAGCYRSDHWPDPVSVRVVV